MLQKFQLLHILIPHVRKPVDGVWSSALDAGPSGGDDRSPCRLVARTDLPLSLWRPSTVSLRLQASEPAQLIFHLISRSRSTRWVAACAPAVLHHRRGSPGHDAWAAHQALNSAPINTVSAMMYSHTISAIAAPKAIHRRVQQFANRQLHRSQTTSADANHSTGRQRRSRKARTPAPVTPQHHSTARGPWALTGSRKILAGSHRFLW